MNDQPRRPQPRRLSTRKMLADTSKRLGQVEGTVRSGTTTRTSPQKQSRPKSGGRRSEQRNKRRQDLHVTRRRGSRYTHRQAGPVGTEIQMRNADRHRRLADNARTQPQRQPGTRRVASRRNTNRLGRRKIPGNVGGTVRDLKHRPCPNFCRVRELLTNEHCHLFQHVPILRNIGKAQSRDVRRWPAREQRPRNTVADQ